MPTVVTLTLSPAVDVASTVARLEPWRKMRCSEPTIEPGGGGVNVARAVQRLGGQSLAVVALGGPVGAQLAAVLRAAGVPMRRVTVRGDTRQNFAVTVRADREQYRFIQPGPPMSAAEATRCVDATVDAAGGADCVVASGSLPPGAPPDVFARLATRVAEVGIPVVVDTSGPALRLAMAAPVAMVKPSVNELRAICGPLDGLEACEAAARRLLDDGRCGVIVVSLGAGGALAVPRDGPTFLVRAPRVELVSASGAGDSMVAGMSLLLARGAPLEEVVRVGVAAGSAATLATGTGLCHRDDVDRLLARTAVEREWAAAGVVS